jgi:hypothetical protein
MFTECSPNVLVLHYQVPMDVIKKGITDFFKGRWLDKVGLMNSRMLSMDRPPLSVNPPLALMRVL